MRSLIDYLWTSLAYGYQQKMTIGRLFRIILSLAMLTYISLAIGQEWISQVMLILCLGSCIALSYKLKE